MRIEADLVQLSQAGDRFKDCADRFGRAAQLIKKEIAGANALARPLLRLRYGRLLRLLELAAEDADKRATYLRLCENSYRLAGAHCEELSEIV